MLRAFLILALADPAAASRVEVGLSAEVRPGNASGVSGASLGTAPIPLGLNVAPLSVAPGAPLVPLPVSAVPVQEQTLEDAPALPVRADASVGEGAAENIDQESASAAGRSLFDAVAPTRRWDLWARLKSLAPTSDIIPAWPGRPGEKVRLKGRTLRLDRPLAGGGGSRVWRTNDRDSVVKILHPEFRSLPHYADEAELLRSIKDADIPHSRLLAASPDGSVMVKEFIEGTGAEELLGRGFTDLQQEGWTELASKLVRAGVTADLAPGNLVWQHRKARWTIVDAGGIIPGGPSSTLDQLMTRSAEIAGVEPGAFLLSVRSRLGPDSPQWAQVLEDLRVQPRHAAALAALESQDRAPEHRRPRPGDPKRRKLLPQVK